THVSEAYRARVFSSVQNNEPCFGRVWINNNDAICDTGNIFCNNCQLMDCSTPNNPYSVQVHMAKNSKLVDAGNNGCFEVTGTGFNWDFKEIDCSQYPSNPTTCHL
ncbi:10180_t:CDS:2, partial [Diversispora eburnea]